MDNTTLIITALVALALGLVIGYLLTRGLHPEAKQRRELEDKLLRTMQEHKQYQHDVTEHFLTTATLVNDLTESYRGLHQHLASSALNLTSPEISRQLVDAGYGAISDQSNSSPIIDPANPPTPPKDYAPKVPGGVLSEDYGLYDDQDKSIPAGRAGKDFASDNNDLDDDPTLKVSGAP